MKKTCVLAMFTLVVFSLPTCSSSLIAQEKRGAELVLQKKDGQQIEGELIAVKQHSLLLLVSGVDASVDIQDVKVIRIVKRSGFVPGLLAGIAAGALCANSWEHANNGWGFSYFIYIPLGALIGGGIGAAIGTDKSIIIGTDDVQNKAILEELRHQARIRNAQ